MAFDSANPFDVLYEVGDPPWEIGRPQPALVDLARGGAFAGSVLDLGCGTGENALFLASLGLSVTGIDIAARAVDRARAKARNREVVVDLQHHDALDLRALGRVFDVVLDSGLFHAFTDRGQLAYVDSLRWAMRPGSTLYLLCFSDREPAWGGPRRLSQSEIRRAFGAEWVVESIDPTRMAHQLDEEGAEAWLARITHLGRVVAWDA